MERTAEAEHSLAIPAIASAAAGVLHAAAAGVHTDHPDLARLFVALAIAQVGAAVFGFVRPNRITAATLAFVNAIAVGGWIATRLIGISWIDGLEAGERPHLADSIAAAFALTAAVTAIVALYRRLPGVPTFVVTNVAVLAGVFMLPALVTATNHDHASHTHIDTATGDGHVHTELPTTAGHDHANLSGATGNGSSAGAAAVTEHVHEASTSTASESTSGHSHDTATATSSDDAAPVWPRPWDPTGPIDFSGVPGLTPEQQARAEQLVHDTLRDLPAFADVGAVGTLGYQSIGDSVTGFEHFINYSYMNDAKSLDPTAPESLVYQVDGEQRTLVSAMFIVSHTPIDDPQLIDFAGPLMQWHVHQNLCFGLDADGKPKVMRVLESSTDTCPPNTVNTGGDNPMVHVWIAPNECGPFAALEGHGAGQADAADGTRADQCVHRHESAAHGDVTTEPYDPNFPVDLGGVPGVTPDQQAFAENLVASTIRTLPQWADLDKVAAAGFHSIGDAGTGHEHYIQWDWIDDDDWLDPDHPESLVFEPQPDGSKKLVSAMFMLPSSTSLDDVPDWGGALMQWHVHGDLCFTDDPAAPQVAGLKPVGGTCQAPLVDFPLSPMIHVWITPTPCGPFAALEGIGGGQVPAGQDVLCDHVHGSP